MDSLRRAKFLLVCLMLTSNNLTDGKAEASISTDTCSYNFKVWEADEDMVLRMKNLEARYANMSNYVDKELLRIRFDGSKELHSNHNWSMSLERAITDLKFKHVERSTDLKDLKFKVEDFEEKLQGVSSKVDDFILNFSERRPKALRRKESSRKDRMIASSVGTQHDEPDKYIISALKNMVSDMKSEWILMKRDLLDMRSEIFDLKQGQNQLHNSSVELHKEADQLQDKSVNLKSSEFKHSNDIASLRSNIDNLKQDFFALKTSQDRSIGDVLVTQAEVTSIQDKMEKLERDVNRLVQNKKATNQESRFSTLRTHGSQAAIRDVNVDVTIDNKIPEDCNEVYANGYRTSGVYQLKPTPTFPADNMYCEMVNNTGYTLVQRRVDGLLPFNRGWLEYKVGFGNVYGDFWAGNELLHLMTKDNRYALRIDMWDWEGNRSYAEYAEFSLENEASSYRLHVSGYSGNAGDSLSYHDKMKFSTEDSDNDIHVRNCAADNKSGWWYNGCYFSQLNGVYHTGWYSHSQSTYADGIVWYTLKDSERYSLRRVEMKLKRNM